MSDDRPGIHEEQPVLTAGAPLEEAQAAMIMVHGRGASARDILTLSAEFNTAGVAFLAPQAANSTWYPYSFLAPMSQNEPHLTSALQRLDSLLAHLQESGIPVQQTMLLGFSQGACLATEFAARNPRPYGAIVGFSGGLIGPPGTPRQYEGTLSGVKVFLGCSDVDPHIPLQRVHETAETLESMEAAVTTRIYPGMGHTVNQDEIEFVQELLRSLVDTPASSESG